jgi:hypothetical protein
MVSSYKSQFKAKAVQSGVYKTRGPRKAAQPAAAPDAGTVIDLATLSDSLRNWKLTRSGS